MKVLQVLTGQTSIYEFSSKTPQMKEHSALGSGSPDTARALCRHQIFIPASRNALQHWFMCLCKNTQFGHSVTAPTFFCRLSHSSFILSTNFSPSQSWKAVKNQPRFSSSNLWQVDNQAKLRCLIADGFPSTKSNVSAQILFFKDDGRVVSGLTASLPACTQCLAQRKPHTDWEFWGPELGSLCPWRHHRHKRLEPFGSAKTNPTPALTCTSVQSYTK